MCKCIYIYLYISIAFYLAYVPSQVGKRKWLHTYNHDGHEHQASDVGVAR